MGGGHARAQQGRVCRWRSGAGWCPPGGPARRWRPEAASTPSQGAVLVGVETVADRLGLVRRVECLGQSEARRSPPSSDRCDRLGLGQGGPVADGAGTARRGRSGAPGPSGRRPRAGAGQRPADRPDPELLTYGSRCTGRSAGRAPALRRDRQADALFQDRAGSSQLADLLLLTFLDPLGVLATWWSRAWRPDPVPGLARTGAQSPMMNPAPWRSDGSRPLARPGATIASNARPRDPLPQLQRVLP